ncbi:endothelin-1 [Pelodytes ibericus]
MNWEMVMYILAALQVTSGAVTGSSISIPEDGSSAPAVETDSRHSSGAPWRPRRFKRCSCSSLMDKECVYFCHLDIIWINTPERTVPYGLGGPRLKRAVQDTNTEEIPEPSSRCMCARYTDKKCLDFCQTAGELSLQFSPEIENNQVQQTTDCSGIRLGVQCIHKQTQRNKKMKSSEGLTQSIKNSFAFARLMNPVNEKKDERQHWTHKKRGLWKFTKTTS